MLVVILFENCKARCLYWHEAWPCTQLEEDLKSNYLKNYRTDIILNLL
jgi:hypothetical protein